METAKRVKAEVSQEALAKCLQQFPLDAAFLFGSHATGDATVLSDVDIAIHFHKDLPQDEYISLLDEITAAVVDCVDTDKVDIIDLEDADPEVAYRAVSRGIPLIGGEKTIARLKERLLKRKLAVQPVKERWRNTLDERLEEGTYATRS